MLCRAVLTALAISYLICVLWLSGLQKEDLDVNMLRKLERHNVNIDDKNRDTLRKDCLNAYTRKDNRNEEKNITTDDEDTKKTTLILENEPENNRKSDESNPNNWSTVLDTLIDEKQKSEENDTTIINGEIELINKTPHLENTNERYNSKRTTDTSVLLEKDAMNGNQPNMENIINFWKMFTTPRNDDFTISASKSTKKNKKVSKKNMSKKSAKVDQERSSKEMEQINKLLTDYFYNNLKPTTTQSTIITTPDFNNLSKLTQQFENFFKLMSKNRILPRKDITDENFKTHDMLIDNNDFIDSDIPQQTFLVQASHKKYIKSNLNKHSVSHLLLYNDQMKKSFAQNKETYPPPHSLSIIDGQSNKQQQFYEVPNLTVSTTAQTTITEKDVVGQQPINIFSKDVIEKIAENVKEIVLKDLRHEITSTTSGSLPTQTEAKTTATTNFPYTTTVSTGTTQKSVENKATDATEVLKSIMELFKEVKALKDNTFSTVTNATREQHKQPQKTDEKHFNNVYNDSPSIIKKDMEMVNPYPYPYIPQSIRESHTLVNNMKNVWPDINNNMFQLPVKSMRATEILQTNSGEIPPLGIPLKKPLLLIHQNILVTTASPLPPPDIINNEHSRERPYNYYTKSNGQNEYKDLRDMEHYQYPNHSQYISIQSDRETSHPRYSYNPNHQDSSHLQYKPYMSHRDTYRDHHISNIPNRYINSVQYNSSPSYHHLQYDSNQLKLNSKPSKYDLLSNHYSTRIPQRMQLSDTERYDISGKDPRYVENQMQLESRTFNRGRNNYRLGYTPRYEVNVQPKISKGFIGREIKNQYRDVSGGLNRHPDTERFHEKLERVDAWGDEGKADAKETEKCCDNLDLASRQQLAINTMKNGYDDSHFTNFLKTQQKVNDMLEKMLSSKTSEPRSVVEVI